MLQKKKKCAAIHKKTPKKLQILKLQYLDFPDSVSDDFFFQLGCFYKRNSDTQPVSTIFSQKYTENFWNVATLFFFSKKKKYAKIKKYLPTMSANESAMIPLVKNERLNTKAPKHIYKKNMQNILYYHQTLEVGKHHTMDPIMERILSCSLASSRGLSPIHLPLQIT
jgi:hypothetical protein